MGVVSGSALVIDYILTITKSVAADVSRDFHSTLGEVGWVGLAALRDGLQRAVFGGQRCDAGPRQRECSGKSEFEKVKAGRDSF